MARASFGGVDISGIFASLYAQANQQQQSVSYTSYGGGGSSDSGGSTVAYDTAVSKAELAAMDSDMLDQWKNGLIGDDEWMSYVNRRVGEESEPKSHAKWLKTQRYYASLIGDTRAELAYKETGDTTALLRYYEGRYGEVEAQSQEGRDIRLKILGLTDEASNKNLVVGSQKIIDGLSEGDYTLHDLVKFYQNSLKSLRPGTELYDKVVAEIGAQKENIQKEDAAGIEAKVKYEFNAGKISGATAASRLKAMAEKYFKGDDTKYYSLMNDVLTLSKYGSQTAGGGGGGGGSSRRSSKAAPPPPPKTSYAVILDRLDAKATYNENLFNEFNDVVKKNGYDPDNPPTVQGVVMSLDKVRSLTDEYVDTKEGMAQVYVSRKKKDGQPYAAALDSAVRSRAAGADRLKWVAGFNAIPLQNVIAKIVDNGERNSASINTPGQANPGAVLAANRKIGEDIIAAVKAAQVGVPVTVPLMGWASTGMNYPVPPSSQISPEAIKTFTDYGQFLIDFNDPTKPLTPEMEAMTGSVSVSSAIGQAMGVVSSPGSIGAVGDEIKLLRDQVIGVDPEVGTHRYVVGPGGIYIVKNIVTPNLQTGVPTVGIDPDDFAYQLKMDVNDPRLNVDDGAFIMVKGQLVPATMLSAIAQTPYSVWQGGANDLKIGGKTYGTGQNIPTSVTSKMSQEEKEALLESGEMQLGNLDLGWYTAQTPEGGTLDGTAQYPQKFYFFDKKTGNYIPKTPGSIAYRPGQKETAPGIFGGTPAPGGGFVDISDDGTAFIADTGIALVHRDEITIGQGYPFVAIGNPMAVQRIIDSGGADNVIATKKITDPVTGVSRPATKEDYAKTFWDLDNWDIMVNTYGLEKGQDVWEDRWMKTRVGDARQSAKDALSQAPAEQTGPRPDLVAAASAFGIDLSFGHAGRTPVAGPSPKYLTEPKKSGLIPTPPPAPRISSKPLAKDVELGLSVSPPLFGRISSNVASLIQKINTPLPAYAPLSAPSVSVAPPKIIKKPGVTANPKVAPKPVIKKAAPGGSKVGSPTRKAI